VPEEVVKKAPGQSKEYKSKTFAQLIAGLVAMFGYDVDPVDLAALLAGIEAGYLIVRRFKKVAA
tara:strand:+ start:1357 stop:1548 length:192 start_codon:yes stop_codon:yes gene_type:complete